MSGRADRKRKAARKAEGKCPLCGGEAESGRVNCRACLDKMKVDRQARMTKGLCDRCGKPTKPGMVNCRECLDKIRAYRQHRIDAGLCPRCGINPPRQDGANCQQCYEQEHSNYLLQKAEGRHTVLRRRAENLCSGCGTPIDPTDTYNGKPRATCDECRRKRRNEKAKQRNWRYPEILKRDGYKCQLCGRTRRLHVHHIDGNGQPLPMKQQNNAPENLITLCQYCHYALTCLRQKSVDREKAVSLLLA